MIAAEGEQKASGALKDAAEVIQQSPHALQVDNISTDRQFDLVCAPLKYLIRVIGLSIRPKELPILKI